MKQDLTAISLFAGVGGICLGFKKAGFKIIWANEIDEDARTTYSLNFPDHALDPRDICTVPIEDIPSADILLAGFPCQAFSVAGYQKGFEDDRGNLFFEIIRILRATKPVAFFLENVKNLASHDKGKTLRIMKEALEDVGYYFKEPCVLNTADYGGIPQNRERIYFVGFLDPEMNEMFKFPEKIPCEKALKDIIDYKEKKDEKYYYTPISQYYRELEEQVRRKDTLYQIRRVYIRENKSGQCPTLTANMGTGGHNVPIVWDDYGYRKLTPRECFSFQGFPETPYYKLPDIANSHLYKQAGNSVSVPVIKRIADNLYKILNKKEIVENSNLKIKKQEAFA